MVLASEGTAARAGLPIGGGLCEPDADAAVGPNGGCRQYSRRGGYWRLGRQRRGWATLGSTTELAAGAL
jgi:hypothetical protein